jgi:uncharacterized membrane protein HdeD (DUF308 family)
MSLSMSPSSALPSFDERANLRDAWGLVLVLGLISMVVGFLAISSAFIATLASVVYFAALLLVAGVTEVVHAVMGRHGKGFALHLLSAALYLLVGLFILEHPVRAAEVLTLLLAAGFLVGGLLRAIFSVVVRFPAWQWVMLNGFVDLFLGFLILNGWPESSLWVIGVFVGIDLLFHGWSWVVLGLTARSYRPA